MKHSAKNLGTQFAFRALDARRRIALIALQNSTCLAKSYVYLAFSKRHRIAAAFSLKMPKMSSLGESLAQTKQLFGQRNHVNFSTDAG